MRQIKLEVRPDYDVLSGRELGKHIYCKSGLDTITVDEKVNLIFPDTVQSLSASFVQGLLANIFDLKGKNKAKEDIHVKMENDELEKEFFNNFY